MWQALFITRFTPLTTTEQQHNLKMAWLQSQAGAGPTKN